MRFGGGAIAATLEGRRRSEDRGGENRTELRGRYRISAELTELFDCPTTIVEGVTEDEAEQIKRKIEKTHG
jgi:hypothetical protein